MVVKIEYFSDMFSKQWWPYRFYDHLMDETKNKYLKWLYMVVLVNEYFVEACVFYICLVLTGSVCVFTGVRPGHMPSAVHLPYPSILDPDTKLMKTPEQLRNTFQEAGVDVQQPLVASCGSGKDRNHGNDNSTGFYFAPTWSS